MVRSEIKSGRTKKADNIQFSITNYVEKKISVYSKIAGSDEYMFLLLGSKRIPHTVLDVFLLNDQEIASCWVEVSGHAVNKSMWDLQDKYKAGSWELIGWGHSHGNGSVFHSGIDNKNTVTVFLDQLAPCRLIQTKKEIIERVVSDQFGELHLTTDDFGGSIYISSLDSNIMPKKFQVIRHIPHYSGSVYSLVTNNDGEFYAECYTKHWCASCNKITIQRKRVNVKKVKLKNLSAINEKKLRQEFERKTTRFHNYCFDNGEHEFYGNGWHSMDLYNQKDNVDYMNRNCTSFRSIHCPHCQKPLNTN
jgi:hypothetical protein